jgi:dipeptidyl aminopeptidase/acylaminoacyl peptidase
MRRAWLWMAAGMLLLATAAPAIANREDAVASTSGAVVSAHTPLRGVVYYTWRCNLWSIRPNGSHQQRVLDLPLCAGTPMVSPDGTMLAFRVSLHGAESRGLATYDLATGAVDRLAGTRHASWVHWSPDGSRISFDRPAGHGHYRVWISRPDGSGARSLRTGFPTAYTAAWAPDGTRVYFATDAQKFRSAELGCRYAPSAIYSIGLHGGHRRLERGARRLDSYPSDVGRALVSVSAELGHDTSPGPRCTPRHRLETVYVADQPVLRNAWYATLSPAGAHLLFHDNGTNSLAIARIDGSHRRPIPNVPRFTYGSWGPAPPR